MHKFSYNWKLKDLPEPFNGKTVFSCFGSGGGSSMGYKLAGYNVIGFNEIDEKISQCYITNLNPRYSFVEDIRELNKREKLPKKLFNLDILDGSPPCSSFTALGRRDKDWGKEKKFHEGQKMQVLDTLFFDFIYLAEILQPKCIVAENVPGILDWSASKYVKKIIADIERIGYKVNYYLLDSSKMGVPQTRTRVFFIALRNDIAKPYVKQNGFFGYKLKLDLEFNEPPILFKEIKTDGERSPIPKSRLKHFYNAKNNTTSNSTVNSKPFGFYYKCFDNLVLPTIVRSGTTYSIQEAPLQLSDQEIISAGTFPTDYNFMGIKPIKLVGLSVPPVMVAQISSRIYDQILKFV